MGNTKLAIIDNNATFAATLKTSLLGRFKGMEVTAVAEPAAPVGFDIFIISADILAEAKGDKLLSRIEGVSPSSLILAYSDDLNIDRIKQRLAVRAKVSQGVRLASCVFI